MSLETDPIDFDEFDNSDFDDFNGNEFPPIPSDGSQQYQSESKIDYRICDDCNVYMMLDNNNYVCSECGLVHETIGMDEGFNPNVQSNYNTSETSTLPLRIVGPNSRGLNKALMSTNNHYNRMQRKVSFQRLSKVNYEFHGNKLPKNVIHIADNLFHEIISKNNTVNRGEVRKGIEAACIYYACIMEKMDRKPKEIALLMNVEQSVVSNGLNILDSLHERGIITIPVITDRYSNFLDRYLECLSISPKYKPFLLELIHKADALKIGKESIPSSKCIGAIFILTSAKNLFNASDNSPINKKNIEDKCGLTKATFTRFSKAIIKNKHLLRVIFELHDIPFDVEIKRSKRQKTI
jgi:transcription initiation factor TFIIIB Brf1 subunit/transcription initiation factor TFIIB